MNFKDRIIKYKDSLSLSQLSLVSFLAVIIIGAILLTMPFSNNGPSAPFIDNLFVATSATCVTGLTTLVIAEKFNLLGQLIVLVMIQIGGVGLMSFVSYFMTLRKHKLRYTDSQLIQSSFNKVELSDVANFLKRIFKYTIFFELFGALMYSFVFITEYGLVKGIYFSVFLSISAFCNAGIDPFGSSSLLHYSSNIWVNLVTAALIICGGLGFIIWFELSDNFKEIFKSNKRIYQRFKAKVSVHTKLVITTSIILIVTGMLQFLIVEYKTMGDIPFWNKLLISFFQSVSYRTAGFSTFDFAKLSKCTLIFACLYMIIGGSVGGTAGGMKVTTFTVVFIKLVEYLKGHTKANVFKRRISNETLLKAYFTISIYLLVLFICLVLLPLTFEGEMTAIIFEAVSAIGTVGLSAGLTPSLTYGAKWIIIFLMFFGRVGMLAISTMHMKDTNSAIEYADSGIII